MRARRIDYAQGRTLADRDILLMRDSLAFNEALVEQYAQTHPRLAANALAEANELRAKLATRDLAGVEERARRGIGLPPNERGSP